MVEKAKWTDEDVFGAPTESDTGQRWSDEDVFGPAAKPVKDQSRMILTEKLPVVADNSSAGDDLAAGWENLKQGFAGTQFAGFDAKAETHRRIADLTAKNPYLTPEQKALIAGVHEKEIADLTQRQMGAAVDIGAAASAASQYAEAPSAQRFNNSKTFSEAWEAFLADPVTITRSTVLRSAAPSLPSVVGGIIGSAAGPGGAAVLAGAGSAGSEFGSAVADGLAEKGADLQDAQSILAVWKQFGPEITEKARTRAGIIGVADAATAGIGSKIAALPGTGMVKKELLGTGVQMVGGAGGEAAAEVATGQELQPGAILGEAVGELGSGAVETGGQIAVDAIKRLRSAPGKVDQEPVAPSPVAPATGAPPVGTAPMAPAKPVRMTDRDVFGAKADDAPPSMDVNTQPSDAQKVAGNYKKGHTKLQGLDITIENPKGTERTSKDSANPWSVTMPAAYGYVKRTKGADGDQVDVFIADKADTSKKVFVIDQVDPETGNFDGHKAILGVDTAEEAARIYHDSYSDGKGVDRLANMVELSMDEFKTWARSGDTSKPLWSNRMLAPAKLDREAIRNPAPAAQDAAPMASAQKAAVPEPGTAKLAPRASNAPEIGVAETQKGSRRVAEGSAPAAGQAPMAARQPQNETEKPSGAIPVSNPRKPITRRDVADDEAITSSGRKVPVKYAIVEAADLVLSQNDDGSPNPAYPAELQPRDRERRVSATQIHDIATKLEPRLLDKSAKASDGAPIMSEDGVMESGNGRGLAIRRAYARSMPGGERYRSYLKEQGYPVDGIKEPVLVRVRQGKLAETDRQSFTREANERDTLELSSPERAMSDSAALSEASLVLYRGGEIDEAGNRDFVKAFMSEAVNKNDRGKMMDENGAISQDAVRRIGNALLAKAYGDVDLIAKLTESTEVSIKGIGGALLDVAGTWAQMRAEAAEGRISKEVDQTKALLEAVRMVDRSRKENRPLALLVGQNDIFSGKGIAVETEFFLSLMYRDTENWKQPVSRKSISEALTFFVGEARKTFEGTDLLGETAARSKDILATAKRKQADGYDASEADQGSLALSKSRDGGRDGEDAGETGGRDDRQAQPRDEAEKGGETARDGDSKDVKPKASDQLVEPNKVIEEQPANDRVEDRPMADVQSSKGEGKLNMGDQVASALEADGWAPTKYEDHTSFTKTFENAAPAGTVSNGTRTITLQLDARMRYLTRFEGFKEIDTDLREAKSPQEAIDKVMKGALPPSARPVKDEPTPSKSPSDAKKAGEATETKVPDKKPTAYGSKNTLVSADRAAELREKLRNKLNNQLGAGIDPEILAMGTELAAFHIEAGARKFGEFARAVAADLGQSIEKLRPYLRSWFNGARDLMEDNGLDITGMETAEEVRDELAKLFTTEPTEAPKAKREGKAKTSRPAGDPLDAAGSWRRADVVVTLDDGGKEKMNAGQAVDLMKSRIKAVSQLLECVRAA